jgi:hypothetical protein
VPVSAPVLVLKAAHEGALAIEKVSVLPGAALAVGVKPYALPATMLVAGVPEMTGAFDAAFTAIEKAGSDAVALLSDTLITMSAVVPTSA